ncbi:MAG: carboxylesterase family protein, partial [Bacteroidota bacterium]
MKRAILILGFTQVFNFSFGQVSVNQSHFTICSGSSATIIASGADSYFWNPSTGLNSTFGNSVTATPNSNIIYTVTGFDASGNSSEATVDFVVNENPVVNIDFVQPSSCNYINGLYENPIYQDIKIDSNIVYANNNLLNGQPVDLTLDIYQPNQLINYLRPAIIVMHGGGFLFGDKSDSTPVALSQYFSKRGYVVYDANYRLGMLQLNAANAGKAYYRAVQDSKACIRYIHKTGTDIGVDTSQIFIVGVSAGAMTAIGTAYLDQNEIPSFINYSSLGLLENAGGYSGFSSKVNAVVSISGGVYDTTTIFDNETEPLYSFHGTADNVIPYYSGLVGGQVLTYGGYSINKAASTSGLNSTLHTFLNGGHIPPVLSAAMDSILSESNSFLYSKLKSKHGENSCAMIVASGSGQFSWSPATALSNPNTNSLTAFPDSLTTYLLTVTDANSCSSQQTVEIKSVTPLSVHITIDSVLNHLNLTAHAIGGQGVLNYLWSNGATSSALNNVGAGNYSITVTSADCQQTDHATITFPEVGYATNLKVVLVNSCGVTFSWNPMEGNLYQKIYLVNALDSLIMKKFNLSSSENSLDISDLLPGTNYFLQITDYTWNDSTAGTSAINFKSKPCDVPILLSDYNVGNDHASLQWNGTCNPDSYRFRYREEGSTDWITTGTTDQHIDLSGLNGNTTYEYLV